MNLFLSSDQNNTPDPACTTFYLVQGPGPLICKYSDIFRLICAPLLLFIGIPIMVLVMAILEHGSMERAVKVALLAVTMGAFFIGITGHCFNVHRVPDFAISSDHLWYRYFRQWYSLAWSDISQIWIDHADRPGEIRIYSRKLSRCHTVWLVFFGPNYRAIQYLCCGNQTEELVQDFQRYAPTKIKVSKLWF